MTATRSRLRMTRSAGSEKSTSIPSPSRLKSSSTFSNHDLLSSDRVEAVGFVKNVHAQFARADVFVIPSLEEGDPLVTYEAALHGLPILASGMGAGRMGDTPGVMEIIDPTDTEAFADALERLASSADLRDSLGQAARKLVQDFSWSAVGARRAEALQARFAR